MNEQRLYQVLLAPHVSEKSTIASEMEGRHTFRVARDATKPEVRKAVEKLFDVKVDSVQIINVNGKVKRFGATVGKRSDWKKAVVRLAEGQDLDFTGMEG
ncbi:MAG: 50S ribosomal protein L23 [Gammaproteobacteria bacterium]|nr:MAG: 50S ribosomal protein L23 [Gammaproteobacteria bacterium]PIE37815.1 MAG: 50S ribosomal protein L23 [Gammaproteobacteria bacterium]